MLSLFRTNQLLLGILLLFYIGFLRIGAFTTPGDWHPEGFGILSRKIYEAIGAVGAVPDIVASILIFTHAFAINIIVANHRLADSVSLFPGLFYALICCALPEFLHLSPLHLANTFFLISLSELLKVYKKPDCPDNIFNVGFWTSVGSLFYPSYLIFVPFGLAGLNALRAYNLREWLMLIVGAIVPYLLLSVVFFWMDALPELIQMQFIQNFAFLNFKYYDDPTVYFKIIFVDAFLLVAIFSYSLYMYKKVMPVQKKIGTLYQALLFGGLTLLFQADIQLDHLLVLAIPLGIMLSFNFQSITPRWAETLHLIIIAVALFFQYQQFLLPT